MCLCVYVCTCLVQSGLMAGKREGETKRQRCPLQTHILQEVSYTVHNVIKQLQRTIHKHTHTSVGEDKGSFMYKVHYPWHVLVTTTSINVMPMWNWKSREYKRKDYAAKLTGWDISSYNTSLCSRQQDNSTRALPVTAFK